MNRILVRHLLNRTGKVTWCGYSSRGLPATTVPDETDCVVCRDSAVWNALNMPREAQ